MSSEPTLFIPHALARLNPSFEGFITRDLSMRDRDWSVYDSPAFVRKLCRLYEEGIGL